MPVRRLLSETPRGPTDPGARSLKCEAVNRDRHVAQGLLHGRVVETDFERTLQAVIRANPMVQCDSYHILVGSGTLCSA